MTDGNWVNEKSLPPAPSAEEVIERVKEMLAGLDLPPEPRPYMPIMSMEMPPYVEEVPVFEMPPLWRLRSLWR